jgi:two-component system, OmpR family, response regulator CpxR
MEPQHLLIIDDDSALCELLTEYLAAEGFSIDMAGDGSTGLRKAQDEPYDLIILDVMLPGFNGFDVLRELRKTSMIPVIMLTARGDPVDRIVGLEVGADDYLSKPFNPRELLARMRAIMRRTRQGLQEGEKPVVSSKIEVGDVVMHTGTRLVLCQGAQVDLTAVEFNLLEILLQKAGHFVAREDLIQEVLGRAPYPYDRSIDVHVSKLRKKLGHRIGDIERIRTIRNVGYLYAIPPSLKKDVPVVFG